MDKEQKKLYINDVFANDKGKIISSLEDLLNKKRRNDENVPVEELQGRFKNAYDELKDKIKIHLKVIVIKDLQDKILVKKEDIPSQTKIQEQILQDMLDSELFEDVCKMAYKTYDISSIYENGLIDFIDRALIYMYYPYWLNHIVCIKTQGHDMYYSTLVNRYSFGNSCWLSVKYKDIEHGLPATIDAGLKCSYAPYIKEAINNGLISNVA